MIDYYETKSQPISRAMVWRAYRKVRSNKGSSGIDQMSWQYLDNNLSTELYKLWNRLSSGSYFPSPVKQVCIAKKDGGIRKLGIPTILDRIAQEVVRHELEKQIEPQFHNSSYGYRPGRNCHLAVKAAHQNTFRFKFALDIDIKGFFDTIDHKLMMKAVGHYCKDKWILMYVERWLKAGIAQSEGQILEPVSGTPQGGVISPLLANIFLHVVFDQWMEKNHSEKPFERYADDIVVHCKSERQAEYLLDMIRKRFNSCKLQLNAAKTKIVKIAGTSEKKYPQGFNFLGFTIRRCIKTVNGEAKLIPNIFVSKESKKSILQKFRSIKIHKRRGDIESIAQEINPVIRGIINYYHKFWDGDMTWIWMQLNRRLQKWVKWEKKLYKHSSLQWLRRKYKENPMLFSHWKLVHP